MSTKSVVICDGCGKECDRAVRITAEASGFMHQRIDAGQGRGSWPIATVTITSGASQRGGLERLDLCSRECAGRLFFGEAKP